MAKYVGPKTDPANLATQEDVTGGGGAPLSNSAPDAITPDQAGAAGTSTDAARADHSHAIVAAAPATTLSATTTNAEGNATSFARSNHTHAISTGTPGTIQPDATAATGSASSLARSDHTHAIAAGAAGTITGTNAEGTSTSFARADHNHAYGALSIPNSALALGPTYETSLPGSPTDGQEIYYAANATNSIIWHLRYRSAARSGSGAWEYLGGPPFFDGPQGSASSTSSSSTGAALTNGPSLTIPATGTYRITYGAEIQSAVNPPAADCGILLYNGSAVAGSIYLVLTVQFDRDRGDNTVKVSPTSGTVYTVRFRNNQARSLSCAAGTIAIVPVFLNPA